MLAGCKTSGCWCLPLKSWKRKPKKRPTAAQRAALADVRKRLRDALRAGVAADDALSVVQSAIAESVHQS